MVAGLSSPPNRTDTCHNEDAATGNDMIHFLGIGIIFGLSAGLAPGPLLMLVISDTLRHGIKAGVKVALAPVVTDLPIILLSLFILTKLSAFKDVLGIISLAGGFFIAIMGYESIRAKALQVDIHSLKQGSLAKGVLANVLNPHPYLFWITVGAPTMNKALTIGSIALSAFLCGFYASLVGSKILLAFLVGTSRSFLTGKVYLYTLRFLGLLLCAFAFVLFRDGAKLLGLI